MVGVEYACHRVSVESVHVYSAGVHLDGSACAGMPRRIGERDRSEGGHRQQKHAAGHPAAPPPYAHATLRSDDRGSGETVCG